jgi:hypothetical protein
LALAGVGGAPAPAEIRESLGRDAIRRRHWGIAPCCAARRAGVEDGVAWRVGDVGSRLFTHP